MCGVGRASGGGSGVSLFGFMMRAAVKQCKVEGLTSCLKQVFLNHGSIVPKRKRVIKEQPVCCETLSCLSSVSLPGFMSL